MDEERLELLLQGYFDQVLAAGERAELELMLLASARAREWFWEMARWNALLRLWGETDWGRRETGSPAVQSTPRVQSARPSVAHSRKFSFRLLWRFAAFVATAAVCVIACQILFEAKPKTPVYRGVAVLRLMSEVAWSEDRVPMQPGEALQPGWLKLDRGAVQLEFARGARLILEGPAELGLVSANEAYLQRGKASAYVPNSAYGFKLGTPEGTVIDHGTEFGCAVSSGDAAEVHVFAGEVTCASLGMGGDSRELKANQALRLDHDQLESIPADRSAFLSEEELARLDAAREKARLETWREASRALRRNPATLVYLDFQHENAETRTFQNLAQEFATPLRRRSSGLRICGRGAGPAKARSNLNTLTIVSVSRCRASIPRSRF